MNHEVATRLTVKQSAIHYFDEHSKLWAERYSDPGNGNLLWERHRTILDLVDEWQPSASMRFIDVGCGAGLLTFDLARRGLQGAGIDGAPSMIETCEAEARRSGISERWQYKQADVEHIPFPDQSFDAAICCGVIEYLPDDGALLREVRRILRPGGRFLLCVTNKYGYSVSFYPMFQRMKRIPGMIRIATAIRALSTGRRSEMMNLPFQARRHSPAKIRQTLAENGFRFERDRFCEFTLLPGPFNMLFPKLEHGVSAKLSNLEHTRLRALGSCYLVSSIVE